MKNNTFSFIAFLLFGLLSFAAAQDKTEIANKLANPVSPMITLPLQFNFDRGYLGTSGLDSNQWTLNVQPVVPFSLNDNWNLISRTIVPLVRTDNIPSGSGIQMDIGDIVQTLFFSPKEPTSDGWILGVGPVMFVPSGSKFSSKSWGTGAAVVALKQHKGMTYGIHMNHIESFAGSIDISNTLIQPFFTYATDDAVSYALALDATYNWQNPTSERWTLPLIGVVSKVFTIGSQPVSIGAGLKYYLQSPPNAAKGFGVRFSMTFIFPKK